MAEVFAEFDSLFADDGTRFRARACGGPMDDGLWQGWIEFVPLTGGEVLRSPRETTQPNRTDTAYWAGGLTSVYLEGAFERALHSMAVRAAPPLGPSAYDEPARDPEPVPQPVPVLPTAAPAVPVTGSVLDPFAVYHKGEDFLRRQLNALSPDHLVAILEAHGLTEEDPAALVRLSTAALADLVVAGVRRQVILLTRM